jgi:RimJ/RimL family protein N-acetyltransferase
MEFSGGKLPHRSVGETRAFIRQLQGWYERHEGIEWGITRKGDDTVIGTCGFYSFYESFHRAETGYELQPAYWPPGYHERGAQSDRDRFWNEHHFGLLNDEW